MLARFMADDVWMIVVATDCIESKQRQRLRLCIPSGEAEDSDSSLCSKESRNFIRTSSSGEPPRK